MRPYNTAIFIAGAQRFIGLSRNTVNWKKMSDDNGEFLISVHLRKRSYSYNVVHVNKNSDDEQFIISANQKTIIIHSNVQARNGKSLKRFYWYDRTLITNAVLITRIIQAIDSQLEEKDKSG